MEGSVRRVGWADSTDMFKRIVNMSVMCMIIRVNILVSIRYAVDKRSAAAVTRRRR